MSGSKNADNTTVAPNIAKFRALLDEYRSKNNMSQTAIAKKHDLSEPTLRNILKGDQLVTKEVLNDWATEVFHVPVDDLILLPGSGHTTANMQELKNYMRNIDAPIANAMHQLLQPIFNKTDWSDFHISEYSSVSDNSPETNALIVLGHILKGEDDGVRTDLMNWIDACPEEYAATLYSNILNLHHQLTERFVGVKSTLNKLGFRQLENVISNLQKKSTLYYGDLSNHHVDGYMCFWDEGDGEYSVELPSLDSWLSEQGIETCGINTSVFVKEEKFSTSSDG